MSTPLSVTPEPQTAEVTGYSCEYRVILTPEQEAIAKRWFGHSRYIKNQYRSLNEEMNHVEADKKIAALVRKTDFLKELPESSIQYELDAAAAQYHDYLRNFWVSRKHDVQRVVISGEDFEVTTRATVNVVGLGELDVEFDEGVPEPFPTKIELLQDPAGDASIRLHYAGESHNV